MTENELKSILGDNIKRYRAKFGLSQAQLAEKINISPNFISELETGKRWISSDTLVNLAEALNTDVHKFIQPIKPLPDGISALLEKYTEEAARAAEDAVKRALEALKSQYLS